MHDGIDEAGAPAAAMEMPRYVSHKQVWALEIMSIMRDDVNATFVLEFCDKGYASMRPDRDMFARYVPVPGDFYVVYADGYKSFSPRKAFLEGYRREA